MANCSGTHPVYSGEQNENTCFFFPLFYFLYIWCHSIFVSDHQFQTLAAYNISELKPYVQHMCESITAIVTCGIESLSLFKHGSNIVSCYTQTVASVTFLATQVFILLIKTYSHGRGKLSLQLYLTHKITIAFSLLNWLSMQFFS